MATDDNLVEAIRLIKAGQKDAARALLEPFLLQNPDNIQAWMWETELFSSDREKVKVLEACLKQNPGNQQVIQALVFFMKRVGATEQSSAPKPTTPSYTSPLGYPEPASSAFRAPESVKPASTVSPFSAPLDLSESTAFMPDSQPVQSAPARPQPLPEKKTLPKKKSKPLKPAARTAILVGLAVVACIALTSLYIGGGYYLNGQVNDAYAVQNCAEIVQQTTFVSIYPQAVFGSMFTGHDQFAQCRSKLDIEQAVEAKNWEQAFSMAQGYLSTYPNGTFVKQVSEQSPKILSTWGADLIASHNYMDGIGKYKQLSDMYPNTPSAQTAPDTILQTYLLWAKGLSDNQSYKDAESTLKAALDYFKVDQVRSDQVKRGLADLYIAWGDNQAQLGDIDNAIITYQKAGEIYPGSADVDLLIARANLQKAVEISKTKNFNKALEKVKEIFDAAQAENIKTEANATRDNILQAYSGSTSPQAVEQLNAAISMTCQGQRPELPIFSLDDEKVRLGLANPFVQLPPDMTAVKPGELHYVICVTEEEDTFTPCNYSGGYSLVRIQYIWQIALYDILTGDVFTTTSLKGAEPAACPPRANFAVNSKTSKAYGLRPSSEQLVEWLTGLNLVK